jgi:hypothetical protein
MGLWQDQGLMPLRILLKDQITYSFLVKRIADKNYGKKRVASRSLRRLGHHKCWRRRAVWTKKYDSI